MEAEIISQTFANGTSQVVTYRQAILPAVFARQSGDSITLAGRDWSAILASGSNDPKTAGIDGSKLANQTIEAEKLGLSLSNPTVIRTRIGRLGP